MIFTHTYAQWLQKIADFLDGKCSTINTLIEKTKFSIEEYKKLKQALITQAVTKGIRPNREMKDSEVEWIGEIPNLWNIARIKDISLVSPFCDFSKINNDDLITYSPMECIKSGFFINKSARYDSLPKSLTPFQNGDIVLAKVTPCFENGNISIMDNLYSNVGLGSSELFVFRCKNVLTKFLFYVLQNDSFKQLGKASMTGIAGLKRISSDFCKNFKICLPPIDEQKEISEYLDKKLSNIDNIISKKNKSLLKNLKPTKNP